MTPRRRRAAAQRVRLPHAQSPWQAACKLCCDLWVCIQVTRSLLCRCVRPNESSALDASDRRAAAVDAAPGGRRPARLLREPGARSCTHPCVWIVLRNSTEPGNVRRSSVVQVKVCCVESGALVLLGRSAQCAGQLGRCRGVRNVAVLSHGSPPPRLLRSSQRGPYDRCAAHHVLLPAGARRLPRHLCRCRRLPVLPAAPTPRHCRLLLCIPSCSRPLSICHSRPPCSLVHSPPPGRARPAPCLWALCPSRLQCRRS